MSERRLLVIDDEVDICATIAEVAEVRGLSVRTLSDSEQVVETLIDFSPHAILLDLMMPGVDGVELLRTLAERVKGVKIAIMSGSDARVLNSARRLGAAHGLDVVAAIEKPLEIGVIRSTLDALFGGAAVPNAANDFSQAMASGQVLLHYLPTIDLQTKAVQSCEALARWVHPQRGTLAPADFIREADQDGLLDQLAYHVMGIAAQQVASWQAAGENITVSVNVTARTLSDLNLPDRMNELCQRYQIPLQRLALEISEPEAMRDLSMTMDVLVRMRLRNISVAIDDFGTGRSSIRELQRLPVTELKIDRQFVVDIAHNRDNQAIVKSIIDLGHNLSLKVVAEGVEDLAAFEKLRELGADYAQGFFIGRPIPAAEMLNWLSQWRQQKA